MSKKLEDLFNLPSAKSIEKAATETKKELEVVAEKQDIIEKIDAATDKIDAALPTVTDLTASDQEMDELAKLAIDNFTDLIDFGMNVDPRVSGVIFQSASSMLGHALTAKMAKMDKKLKMVDLQLKKARLDQVDRLKAVTTTQNDDTIEGTGTVIDRNALLQTILANAANAQKMDK